jgi:ATPase subunit of ABC transporter with duplicated ATPase domains
VAIILNDISFGFPGAETLFFDVSLKVLTGATVGLIGENAAGKSTLLRIVAGQLKPEDGAVQVDGSLRYMPQSIGLRDDPSTVREFLAGLSDARISQAAHALWAAEVEHEAQGSETSGMRIAEAVAEWSGVDGYEIEATWDAVTMSVLRQPLAAAAQRPISELSGGERKRLALETLLLSEAEVLLLDEPDNFLDIPSKRWLGERLLQTRKTVLIISHDRELLTHAVDQLVTVEGFGTWTHHGGFDTYHEARDARNAKLGNELDRWKEEERRLYRYFKLLKQRAEISDAMAKRASAAESRWRRFVEVGPPPPPPPTSTVSIRLRGKDSGRRVVRLTDLELTGLTEPFSVDLWFQERVAVLGPNGSGKTHFMRLLAAEPVGHSGSVKLGARVQPAFFQQTNERPDFHGRTPLAIVAEVVGNEEAARRSLGRYGLARDALVDFARLSGGQQARLQILLLELDGANLLLLDEPTDNLDLASAVALEDALEEFEGTVIAVTHDRWFLRSLDRFVVFDLDGSVHEALDLESAMWAIGASDQKPTALQLIPLDSSSSLCLGAVKATRPDAPCGGGY